jgi:hypothetical protein
MWNKYELKETLRNGVYTVVFEKVDGTERRMECTLDPTFMPAQLLTEQQETAKIRNENDDVLAVWDTQAKGWRSFHVSKIKEVS